MTLVVKNFSFDRVLDENIKYNRTWYGLFVWSLVVQWPGMEHNITVIWGR